MERRIIEEKSFPSSLENRLASVANAINTELKSATLLHLDDTPREAREIKQRVRETIGKGYLPVVNTFKAYGNTLHDIALVARQTIVRDTGEVAHVGYSLTEAGNRYGLSAAVMSLEYSIENNISMFQILGSTTSHGDSRSPYNRMKILDELRKKRELREIDLERLLNLSKQSINYHLEALTKIGFVALESVGAKQKGKYTYKWIPGKSRDDVRTIYGWAYLTKRVADYLAHHDTIVECNTLSKVLEHKFPGDISKILSGLVKQGCAERTSHWKAREIQSTAKILDEGKKWLDEFYVPLRELLSDNFLDFQEKAQAFRNSKQFPYYMRRGIELYKSISPQINRKSPSERKEQIKHLIINNHGLTTREIAEKLNVSFVMAREYIAQLDGIRKEKEGQETRYFIDGLA
ncbi:helix-turn-helix transcriptional regulator [Candidatus Pacearchaeota archaeon]|nr:helix-turn-helix transcriptional regulator [Candidatus Pacearchaeota archaeon]